MIYHSTSSPPAVPNKEELRQMAQAAELLLLPWDLLESPVPDRKPQWSRPGLRFLKAWIDKTILVSNDSVSLPREIAARIVSCGLCLPEERILLAGHQTLSNLKETHSTTPMSLVAEAPLQRFADQIGLKRTGLDAELLVVLQDRNFSQRTAALAASLVHKGIDVIVANTEGGAVNGNWVTPGAWSHLQAVLAAAARLDHPVTVTGMPSADLYNKALAIADVVSSDALLIDLGSSSASHGATALGIATANLGDRCELDQLI